MLKPSTVAYGVRVKFTPQYEPRCLGDENLKEEPVIFICDEKIHNDIRGEYVRLRGGSLINSGYAYLNELELEFPVPDKPMYDIFKVKGPQLPYETPIVIPMSELETQKYIAKQPIMTEDDENEKEAAKAVVTFLEQHINRNARKT